MAALPPNRRIIQALEFEARLSARTPSHALFYREKRYFKARLKPNKWRA